MRKRYIISLGLVALLFIISGCGGGGEDAPADATINIEGTNTIEVAEGSTLTTYASTFLITVKDPKGTPLNDVDITISYPWATSGAYTGVVQFYDGFGGNPVDSPLTATTDKNGAYTIHFTYMVGDTTPLTAGGDLVYKGDFQVSSGSVFKSAIFEVKTASGT